MKNLKIVIAALLLFVALVGIVSAAPPPPVPQQLGRTDTEFPNVTVTECRGCHGGQPTPTNLHPAQNLHHYMIGKRTTTLGCPDCHPNVLNTSNVPNTYDMFVEPDCRNCHNGTGWYMNPLVVNLTAIRGAPGRPHHNTSKNSASNLAVPAKNMAADRHCKTCHGDGLLDNYDDGHQIKNLPPQLLSVFADFKINATQNQADTGVPGVEWGGCAACHDSAAANPIINNNHDNHHYETTSMLGRQCNYCHVSLGSRAEPIPDYSSDPSGNPLRIWLNDSNTIYMDTFVTPPAPYSTTMGWDSSQRHIEISNWTMLTASDTINGTGCLKCHSFRDIHTIEASGPNPSAQYNIDNKIPGYGHIGNNTDCDGCHAGFSASAVYVPPGQLATGLTSVEPGNMIAGKDTDVTLTGDNFNQPTYTTTVLLDGQPVTPKSIADKQIVFTVPGTTSVGTHDIQVDVGGATGHVTGPLFTLTVAQPVTITSAKLTSGVITITGASFGTDAQQMVSINKATGTVASDSIKTWTDTQIEVASTLAVIGDTVTVTTPYGEVTATIEAGTPVQTPVLTTINVTPATATLNIGGSQSFTAAGFDQFGKSVTIDPATAWSSDKPTVGTIDTNTGKFTAVGAGTVTVTAKNGTSGTVSGTATVTVTIPPPSITSATLKSGTLTIVGTAFGTTKGSVTVVHSGKTYNADSITSWIATKIVAKFSGSKAAVGDTVTIKTADGKTASAKIAKG